MKNSLAQVAQSWERALANAQPQDWSEISAQYLAYLVRRGLLSKARSIASDVVARARKRAGVVPVTVRSARKLDSAEAIVAEVFPGVRHEISEVVDLGVIGGAEISTPHQRVRASHAHALNQFKKITM